MKKLTYHPRGVCSRSIEVTMEGDVVREVRFVGGCAGNTQGVAALIAGMKVTDAVQRIRGIRCGLKPTSCPDQLANALEACAALPDEEQNA